MSSSEEPGLTDRSSKEEVTIPGERARRLVMGFERFRRARRSRKKLIQPFINPSSENEPSELSPSSEEEWPDPIYVNYVDHRLVREGPRGDSLAESITGGNEPKPLRKILKPSKIEKTALEVLRHVRFASGICN